MERKNWLIRTVNNRILGPISKDKLKQLYLEQKIKAEDEVCSGNGYWFKIKEKELVEKYLVGSVIQAFNPISEAITKLPPALEVTPALESLSYNKINKTQNNKVEKDKSKKVETEAKFPDSSDLDYPDLNQLSIQNENGLSYDDSNDDILKQLELEKKNEEKTEPSISVDLNSLRDAQNFEIEKSKKSKFEQEPGVKKEQIPVEDLLLQTIQKQEIDDIDPKDLKLNEIVSDNVKKKLLLRNQKSRVKLKFLNFRFILLTTLLLLLSLLYLNSEKILNFFPKRMLSSLFVSDSYAQTLQVTENKAQLQEVKTSIGTIQLNKSIAGDVLIESGFNEVLDCKNLNLFDFALHHYLFKLKVSSQLYQEKLRSLDNKCKFMDDDLVQMIIQRDYLRNYNMVEFKNLFKRNKILQFELFEKVWITKEQIMIGGNNQIDNLLSFDFKVLSSLENDDRLLKIKELDALVLNDDILKKIFSICKKLLSGDQRGASVDIFNLINQDKENISFQLNFFGYRDADKKEKLINFLIQNLSFIKKEIENKESFDYLSLYLKPLILNLNNENLNKLLDLEWSLQTTREKLKKGMWGIASLQFWVPFLFERMNQGELQTFMNKSLKSFILSNDLSNSIFIFEYAKPVDLKFQIEAVNEIKKLRSSAKDYDRELFLRLMNNRSVRQLYYQEDKNLVAQFKLKRSLYKDFIFQGIKIEKSLFELMSIGDKNIDYLWWLII